MRCSRPPLSWAALVRAALFVVVLPVAQPALAQQTGIGVPISTQATTSQQTLLPYTEVSVSGDKDIARIFFLSTCPFCRAAHGVIRKWGATIPHTLRFVETPVVLNTPDTLLPAAAFYAMTAISAERLPEFVEAMYTEIQGRHKLPGAISTYKVIARSMGMSPDKFVDVMKSPQVRNQVFTAARLTQAYGLTATPSITVGGRYLVTPEATQGVNSRFFDLLNAVTSKYLIDSGRGQ